jgi:hypothetical protein
MEPSLPELEQRRARLYEELAGIGDLRRGSITANYRRCGRANCACAAPGHPGHGPRYLLTRSVAGRTEARQLAGGPELEKARREVAAHKRFVALGQRIVEVNEAICEARPVSPLAGEVPPAGAAAEKKGSSRTSGRSSPPS